ncbi:MAG TPA: class II aldolase/adducin family protein [Dehalococcoidia bacterium]|jgi:L-fuculose-phosphate aldolase|nr:class II aldolase/adducin family protein [Dehalococcoidia bacterium]
MASLSRPRRHEVPADVFRNLRSVGGDLYRLGLVSSHGGNLSIRDGHSIWITGTGMMLGHLEVEDISLVRPGGDYEGPPPSTDTVLHSAVYALSDVGAIAHAHPRHATAISMAQDRFEPEDFEGQAFLGEVPICEAGPEQIAQIAQALSKRPAVLLRGHGAFASGGSLWEALHWLTALEESAHISVIRRSLGPN